MIIYRPSYCYETHKNPVNISVFDITVKYYELRTYFNWIV